MKKFAFALFAMASTLAITPAALASTLCPSQALTGGFGATYINVPGSLDGTCGANSAVTMSIPTDTDEAKLYWQPGDTGYPAGLKFGNLPGIIASVSLSPANADQPYYMFAFTDNGDAFLDTTTGDHILLLEFQPVALSGPGNDTLAFDPTTTLFNLYDNTKSEYLEGGQSDVHTLDGWMALDPSLSNDSVQEIEIAMGLAGGPSAPESLTVDSVVVTPEPTSLLLLGTGLVGFAGMLRRKLRG